MENNNKLLAVRDTVIFLFSKWELSPEECREVLKMCEKEVDVAEKRTGFSEIKKED